MDVEYLILLTVELPDKKSRTLQTAHSHGVLSNGSALSSQAKRFFLKSKTTCRLNISFQPEMNFQINKCRKLQTVHFH
jgi:hypothetical protein